MILLRGLLRSIVYSHIKLAVNNNANILTKFELSFFYHKTIILMVKIKPNMVDSLVCFSVCLFYTFFYLKYSNSTLALYARHATLLASLTRSRKGTLRNALDFCAFGAIIKRISEVPFPQ
jgi:hypothetical protein